MLPKLCYFTFDIFQKRGNANDSEFTTKSCSSDAQKIPKTGKFRPEDTSYYVRLIAVLWPSLFLSPDPLLDSTEEQDDLTDYPS